MIVLDRVTFQYPQASTPALVDVSLRIPPGELALVVGPSGSGKSTLLRCLNGLVPHFTGGRLSGAIEVAGRSPPLDGPAVLGGLVGFVFQDPEAQFVLERVEDEVAFALENRALPRDQMVVRVERALDVLGLLPLRDRPIATLSGGQKQRVAIAAALVLEPAVLVLDEPTSQLDPRAADEVLAAIVGLRDALGLTVVLAEHRLERVLYLADRLVLVEAGRVRSGHPRDLAAELAPSPPLVALARAFHWHPTPLTIAEARPFADRIPAAASVQRGCRSAQGDQSALQITDLSHSYLDATTPSLQSISMTLHRARITALIGPNGSGKTTLLRCLLGLLRPTAGAIELAGDSILNQPTATIARRIGYLPQLSDDLLFAETVADELATTLRNHGLERSPPIDPATLLKTLGLDGLEGAYPRDLSVGQRQRVALAAISVTRPAILLLDEPTRGQDQRLKDDLADLLRQWRGEGTAILVVTHDLELAASIADDVVELDEGRVKARGAPSDLLATQVARLFPGRGWLTPADAIAALSPPPPP